MSSTGWPAPRNKIAFVTVAQSKGRFGPGIALGLAAAGWDVDRKLPP